MSRVLVPIADGSEELEAVTLIDLLRRAGILVTVASLDGEPVTASRGVKIIPDVSLDGFHLQVAEVPGRHIYQHDSGIFAQQRQLEGKAAGPHPVHSEPGCLKGVLQIRALVRAEFAAGR